MSTLVIATRRSRLALWQSEHIKARLEALPQIVEWRSWTEPARPAGRISRAQVTCACGPITSRLTSARPATPAARPASARQRRVQTR